MKNLKINDTVYITKSFGLSGTSGIIYVDKNQPVVGVVVKDLGEQGKEIYVSKWNIRLYITKQTLKDWDVQLCSHSRRVLIEKYV